MSTTAAGRDDIQNNNVDIPADAVEIVLLGLTDSGKSSLLGALSRCSEVQERLMQGRLTDLTNNLRSLRQSPNGNETAASFAELNAYLIRFEPFTDGRPDATRSTDFVLIDPSGRQASELIASQNGLPQKLTQGKLGTHLAQADTVLLILDASAPDSWIDAGFNEFLQYLRQFRLHRGQETDVAGLPVFLVMTKCDLLARPRDSLAVWIERVEARKEEAVQRFEEILREQHDPAFGSIKFSAHATAVRFPELTNLQTQRDEPCGVAELFRDVTAAARDHHDQRQLSSFRLRHLLLILGVVVAFLIGFAAVLTLKRTLFKPSELVAALTAFRDDEGAPPAGHLSEPLAQRIDQLQTIKRDPQFSRFDDADRTFVTDRLDELQKFRDFSTRVRSVRLPAAARDLEELDGIEKQLRYDMAIPERWQAAWSATSPGQRRERMLQQIPVMRSAAKRVTEAYERQRQQLDRLFVFADRGPNGERLPWQIWAQRVDKQLAAADDPPLNPDDRIPDWPSHETERPPNMAIPLALLDMAREQQRVKAAAERLAAFRDITQVLGLTHTSNPNLRVGNEFSIDQAPALLSSFRFAYPRSASWSSVDIPDVAMQEVKQAARQCYEQLLTPARSTIANLLVEAGDVQNPLQSVTGRAAALPAFKAWNELAQIVTKLMGINSDPLAELEKFAIQTEYSITIQELTMTLPADLPGGPFLPNGSWTLHLEGARGVAQKRILRPVEPIEAGKPWRFRAEDVKSLVYRPGESLWAEVNIRDAGGKDWVLSWVGFPQLNRRYQFDRLNRAPRLHRLDEKPEAGKFVLDVKLDFQPPGGVPRLPDLVPDAAKK